MQHAVKIFLKAAFIYLILGVLVGFLMALGLFLNWEWTYGLRLVHTHFLLIGFVGMTIFGVGYHVFPRLTGNKIPRPQWVSPHFYLVNYGLWGMALGFLGESSFYVPYASTILLISALLLATGLLLFAINGLLLLKTPNKTTSSCDECEECGEEKKETTTSSSDQEGCFKCGNSEGVLISCQIKNTEKQVCVRCLPALIHGN